MKKRGPKPKPTSQRASKTIMLRVKPSKERELRAAAVAAGISLSAYLRREEA